MDEMKIDIKPEVKHPKKGPYKLAHKYNEIVKKEIDNMKSSILYISRNGKAQWSFN